MAEGLLRRNIIASSGGGGTTGDYLVRFLDTDGTVLKEEWVNSGEDATAPNNPDRTSEGLTFTGWNASYTGITQHTDVGAIYETTDGKTHVFITLTSTYGLDVTLYMNKSNTDEMTVDWGDGSTPSTFTNSGNFNTGAHTYPSYGNYEIKIWMSSGTGTYTFGNNSISYPFMLNSISRIYKKIFIGEDVLTLGGYAFTFCYSLIDIVIPDGITTIGTYALDLSSLRFCSLPTTITTIGDYAFASCRRLFAITIPANVSSKGIQILSGCNALVTVTYLSASDTIIKDYELYTSSALGFLTKDGIFTVPATITAIYQYAFGSSHVTLKFVFLGALTSISSYAFRYAYAAKEYDFTHCTSVPTLASSNVFENIAPDCVIKVPSSLYSSWIAATNWSTYANYIEAV